MRKGFIVNKLNNNNLMNHNNGKFFVLKDKKNINEQIGNCLDSFRKIEKVFFPKSNIQINSKSFIFNLAKNLKVNFTWNLEDHKNNKIEINYSKSLMSEIHNLNTMSMTGCLNENIKEKPFPISSSFFRKNAQNIPSSDKNLAKAGTPEVCISKDMTFNESSSYHKLKQDSLSSIFNSSNNMVHNFGNSASNNFIKFNLLDSYSKKYHKNMDQKPSNCLTENSRHVSVFSFKNERSQFNLIKHRLNNEFYSSNDNKNLLSKRERSIKKVVQGLISPRNKISFFGNFKFCEEDSVYNDETKLRKLLKRKRRLHYKNPKRRTNIKQEAILIYEPLENDSKDITIHGSFNLF